jgi:exopolyphosphatase/guanosine-5'-triphosphate,3'-diphosphate pyrophosphatase
VTPGSLLIAVADRETTISMVAGDDWTLPVGPALLVERELERADRPAPEQLTNALGIVADHLDDVVRASAMVLDAPTIAFTGHHAVGLGRVELGVDTLPADHTLTRADADEVFRMLVAEPIADRLHNPGLDPADVETVIGTCCVVLAFMRRLERSEVMIIADPGAG